MTGKGFGKQFQPINLKFSQPLSKIAKTGIRMSTVPDRWLAHRERLIMELAFVLNSVAILSFEYALELARPSNPFLLKYSLAPIAFRCLNTAPFRSPSFSRAVDPRLQNLHSFQIDPITWTTIVTLRTDKIC